LGSDFGVLTLSHDAILINKFVKLNDSSAQYLDEKLNQIIKLK
jgi:hypothetical protein